MYVMLVRCPFGATLSISTAPRQQTHHHHHRHLLATLWCVAKPSVSPPDAQPRRIVPEVDFDHCTTSAVIRCISLPSFSAIERCAAELLRFYWFFLQRGPKLHHGSRRGALGTLPNFSWTYHRSYTLLNGFKKYCFVSKIRPKMLRNREKNRYRVRPKP